MVICAIWCMPPAGNTPSLSKLPEAEKLDSQSQGELAVCVCVCVCVTCLSSKQRACPLLWAHLVWHALTTLDLSLRYRVEGSPPSYAHTYKLTLALHALFSQTIFFSQHLRVRVLRPWDGWHCHGEFKSRHPTMAAHGRIPMVSSKHTCMQHVFCDLFVSLSIYCDSTHTHHRGSAWKNPYGQFQTHVYATCILWCICLITHLLW